MSTRKDMQHRQSVRYHVQTVLNDFITSPSLSKALAADVLEGAPSLDGALARLRNLSMVFDTVASIVEERVDK